MASILDRYTQDELMAMDKKQVVAIAKEIGKVKELRALFEGKVEKKRYPRVLKPSKNPELAGKLTWQADTDAEPEIRLEKPDFFIIKAKFFHEVCGLPYVEKEEAEDSFLALVEAALAEEEDTASIDAALGFNK